MISTILQVTMTEFNKVMGNLRPLTHHDREIKFWKRSLISQLRQEQLFALISLEKNSLFQRSSNQAEEFEDIGFNGFSADGNSSSWVSLILKCTMIDGKHSMRFQRENSVFNLLQRSMERGPKIWHGNFVTLWFDRLYTYIYLFSTTTTTTTTRPSLLSFASLDFSSHFCLW